MKVAVFWILVLAAAALTPWLHAAWGLLTFMLVLVAGLVHAVARKPRWRIAGPLAIVCVTFLLPTEVFGLSAYRMPEGHHSVVPAIEPGERFIVDMRATEARLGDMVVFDVPGESGPRYVKRVAGLAGDTVRGDAKGISRNGELVFEGNVTPFEVTVPEGHVYVIGDNTTNSRDSRHFGPVKVDAIRGRVLYVFWSKDLDRIGARVESRDPSSDRG